MLSCAVPRAASAYTIETILTEGCHELVTSSALRATRDELGIERPPPAGGNDEAYVRDVQFIVDEDQRDIAAVTLLVGVRDNDLKGHHSRDITNLAAVHNDPSTQHEHCLRAPGDDEPAGSQATIDATRDFIRAQALHAIRAGIDCSTGEVDLNRRTPVEVYLSMRKDGLVMAPTFHLYMGQALHAVQDSFTHAFRSNDQRRIVTALNWVELTGAEHDERRDGPPHMSDLDDCRDLDPLREDKLSAATEASTELLRISLDPAIACDQKEVEIDAFLDRWFGYEDGCSQANHWCDAPEMQFQERPSCSAVARANPSRNVCAVLFGVLALLALRRRRRSTADEHEARAIPPAAKSGARAARPRFVIFVFGTTLLWPAHAHADDQSRDAAALEEDADELARRMRALEEERANDEPPRTPPRRRVCVPGRQVHCACHDGVSGVQVCSAGGTHFNQCRCPEIAGADRAHLRDSWGPPEPDRWLGYFASAGASIDNPAVAVAAGPLFFLNGAWIVAAAAEWNGWASFDSGRATPGVMTAYGGIIRRFHINRWASVRFTARLGVSWLLFDLVDAPAGSYGLHAGISWLGVEFKLGKYRLVIDPIDVRLPPPVTVGVPLKYRQYRFTVGLQR